MPPFVPEYVREGLANIRPDMHLRWNPKAVLMKPGSYDAIGRLREPAFDPRWEVWDKDPDGAEYFVMRLQNMDGSFRAPGEWLLNHLQRLDPARYGGDVRKMLDEVIEKPELLREVGTQKDSDDLIEAVAKWGAWVATPKSAAGLTYRGQRMLST